MDTIAFSTSESWAGTRLEIRINGRSLIEMVREVEAPFARAEGHPDLAGEYMGLPVEDLRGLFKHLLGEPDKRYGGYANKTDLLVCTCGEEGCWPFCADVQVGETEVVWLNFFQPHRGSNSAGGHWRYDVLGSFCFKRTQYEEALRDADLPNP